MTAYEVSWGRNEPVSVSTVDELDAVIADVERQRGDGDAPFQLSIAVADDSVDPFDKEVLSIGVGHPERAFAFWAGEGGGWGREPGVDPLPDDVAFDLGGQWTEYYPDQTCVTAETAKKAARQYVETGRRPTTVEWQ